METNIYQKLLNVKAKWIKLQRDTKAFNYKYATLSQIQEKFSDELQNQKLVVIHYIKDNEVVTEIRDTESELFVASSIRMNDDVQAQDKGSEITYFRRYNLLSLLDLEVEDDDGKKANDSTPNKDKEKVVWYNDTEKHIDTWRDLVADGKTTWKELLAKVTDNWKKKIKGLHKDMILNLDNK